MAVLGHDLRTMAKGKIFELVLFTVVATERLERECQCFLMGATVVIVDTPRTEEERRNSPLRGCK